MIDPSQSSGKGAIGEVARPAAQKRVRSQAAIVQETYASGM
jgi:hypothetical protein